MPELNCRIEKKAARADFRQSPMTGVLEAYEAITAYSSRPALASIAV